MDLAERAQRHAALGDERRLLIVDQLSIGDRSAAELAKLVSMPGNLLAHHLDVLEAAGLIERNVSEGDHRRRYVSLCWEQLSAPVDRPLPLGRVAFLCTHNSARSQFAAELWRRMTGFPASSAGTHPAKQVNRLAVKVAAEFGVDISGNRPSGYESLPADLELLISVCDRANEAIVPDVPHRLHWSIPDPIPIGTLKAFRSAFADIAGRIGHVVGEGPS